MNTAQPALLYLVPCVLLSTITTGLCRGNLKELYSGRRIKYLLEKQSTNTSSSLSNTPSDASDEQNNLSTADMAIQIHRPLEGETPIENP